MAEMDKLQLAKLGLQILGGAQEQANNARNRTRPQQFSVSSPFFSSSASFAQPKTDMLESTIKDLTEIKSLRDKEIQAREALEKALSDPNSIPGRVLGAGGKVTGELGGGLKATLGGSGAGSIEETLKALSDFTKGNGGGFEPGTTMSVKTPLGNLNIPLNREVTSSENKDLASSGALLEEIGALEQMLGLGTELKAQLPFQGFSKKAQEFKLLRDSVGERLLRLRSGAQINEQEFKRLMELLPKATRFKNIDKKQLQRFKREFQGIQDRIRKGLNAPSNASSLEGGGGITAGTEINAASILDELEKEA